MNKERQFGECVAEMVENTNKLVLEQLGLIAENAKLRAMLRRVEWCIAIDDCRGIRECPICEWDRQDGHADGCELAALLED